MLINPTDRGLLFLWGFVVEEGDFLSSWCYRMINKRKANRLYGWLSPPACPPEIPLGATLPIVTPGLDIKHLVLAM